RVADDQADLLVAVKILRRFPASLRRDAPDGEQCRRQQPDGLHNGHARFPKLSGPWPPAYSGLRFANFTTLPHFSVSAAMNLANSVGAVGNTVEPSSA